MTETIDLICNRCKHTNSFRQGCDAFPDDIPMEILLTNKHSKPLLEQKNSLVFEPRDSVDSVKESMKDVF